MDGGGGGGGGGGGSGRGTAAVDESAFPPPRGCSSNFAYYHLSKQAHRAHGMVFERVESTPEAAPSSSAVDGAAAGVTDVGAAVGAAAGGGTLHEAPQRCLVVNTHLHWDPQMPEVKALQAAMMMREVTNALDRWAADGFDSEGSSEEEDATNGAGEGGAGAAGGPASAADTGKVKTQVRLQAARWPCVVVGDMNSVPLKTEGDVFDALAEGETLVSGVYTLMTEGSLAPSHPHHPLARSGYRHIGPLRGMACVPASYRLTEAGAGEGEGEGEGKLAAEPTATAAAGEPDPDPEPKAEVEGTAMAAKVKGGMGSAYARVCGAEPAFTNYTAGFKDCLDYLFYTPQRAAPVAVLAAPEEAEMAEPYGAIPNERYPSDHVSLMAWFALR
mmetsp:Transcript_30741/g.85760  ORF Transcript_30741/g.85760 Transcript_30741/m.85760 type:complete len:387 (+) Transcript_30741:2-1162(+)